MAAGATPSARSAPAAPPARAASAAASPAPRSIPPPPRPRAPRAGGPAPDLDPPRAARPPRAGGGFEPRARVGRLGRAAEQPAARRGPADLGRDAFDRHAGGPQRRGSRTAGPRAQHRQQDVL